MIKELIDRFKRDDSRMVISYLQLRTFIGLIGILLPLILVLAYIPSCEEPAILDSISGYYHSAARDWFVGVLFALALFLFSYNGYDWRDALTARIGAVAALGVALFPTTNFKYNCQLTYSLPSPMVSTIHYISAAVLFGSFIIFAWRLFTISTKDDSDITDEKKKRNTVYKVCALIMTIAILLIGLYAIYEPEIDHLKPVFWLETIALVAFGVSWLTKAEVFFPDK